MRYVIIGGCIAAMGAVEGIRSIDKKGSITILDGEQRGVYSRPLISYYLAQPDRFKNLAYRSAEYLDHHGVDVMKGWAVQIDRSRREVVLHDGQIISYDRLLIATGAAPFIPDISGIKAPWVKTFYTIADVEALDSILTKGHNALIIGSGLIGMKAAESLRQRGLNVSVIEKERHILPRILSPESANMVNCLLNEAGIKTQCGEELTAVNENQVNFASGLCLPVDILVLAMGTKPHIELAMDAGLKVNQGIMVDEYLQTSDENIYAAGDVIETRNIITGTSEIMALLPLAHREGYLAGVNMAGSKSCAYEGGIFMNSLNILGISICSAGSLPRAETEFLVWQEDHKYLQIFLDGDFLCKYIAVNLPEVTGPLTNTIADKIRIEKRLWQHFMTSPTLSAFPDVYWQKLRKEANYDYNKCS